MEKFKDRIAEALTRALSDSAVVSVVSSELETPPDRALGDFAYPCFKLAKTERKPPPLIAAELAGKLQHSFADDPDLSVKSVGPYVNFSFKMKAVTEVLLAEVLEKGDRYGERPPHEFKWVFEYSSPNVAKPFQIYHLRTTIVGSALSKVAKHRGYQVTTINHLGDWGTQYGKIAVALKRYASELPPELGLKDLVDVYVKIHKDMESDPTIEPEGQANFLKLEQGDAEMRALWKKCVDISIREFKKTYARYQVEFDHYWGESHYESFLKPLLADLKARKIAVEDQGAQIVRGTDRAGHEIPPTILEKSDGASIYASRDVAAAVYRYEKFHFDRMSYVVGKEQKLHFEQVFAVLRAMGLSFEPRCEHIATGLYRFKDAKMSTRKGNFVTLEEVNELCMQKALSLMTERNAQAKDQLLNEAETESIAEQVTVGAIIFADLSTDPSKDMEFDVDRVISFEGETGPYLQYAHTRCQSILRKGGIEVSTLREMPASLLTEQITRPEEHYLIKTLARFSETLDRTLEQRKPSQLTTYLIDLARDFGNFYRECKVIQPENANQTRARLALVSATQNVLSLGLRLLGIPTPEKM